jgi:rhodanese-related sulfurtransferase
MKCFSRVVFGALFSLILLGCDEPNPLYLGPAGPGAQEDANAAASDTAVMIGDDGGLPVVERDASPLLPDALAGDGGIGMCSPNICEANFGKAACGSWACASGACQVGCPNCQDKDHDGFGIGSGCAGLDCDDNDPKVRAEVAAPRSCYNGPVGTAGKGICKAGSETCAGGVWTECQGLQLPIGESCNNEDDDCNGKTDDLPDLQCGLGLCATSAKACAPNRTVASCQPKAAPSDTDNCGNGDEDCDGLVDEDCAKCVHVTGFGIDAKADGSTKFPFRSIQAAVDFAAADATRPQLVCVAAGATCMDQLPNQVVRFAEGDARTLSMKNGVSVTGGYESTNWTLCPIAVGSVVPRSTPVLVVRSPEGVLFSEAITKPTSLSGFVIERSLGGKTSSAITIRGAKGATVTNVVVLPMRAMDVTIGVDVSAKAEALVARSDIQAGEGTVRAIAVRVKESIVGILDNCGSFDDKGRCKSACAVEGTALSAGLSESKGGETIAVLLESATAALVQNNGLCAGPGKDSAAIKIMGSSANTIVSGNVARAAGGTVVSAGAWFAGCEGAKPWVVSNQSLVASAGGTDTQVSGVLSEGDCQPRIESNLFVAAHANSAKTVSAIHCAVGNAKVGGCQILRNFEIRATGNLNTEMSIGLFCEGGACGRIAGNTLVDAGRAKRTVGLWLDGGTARVETNLIQGGCGISGSTGVLAVDNGSRVDNNVIFGAACDNNLSVVSPVGVSIVTGQTRRSIDLHSNTIDTARGNGDCEGITLAVSTRADTQGGTAGVVRNNIFSHSVCHGTLLEERDAKSHLFVMEANLFDKDRDLPVMLANGKDLLSLSDVNKNSGLSLRRNNILGEPKFIDWPTDLHLENGSAAIDKGTPTGAPVLDFAFETRDAKPDIGAFEKN